MENSGITTTVTTVFVVEFEPGQLMRTGKTLVDYLAMVL